MDQEPPFRTARLRGTPPEATALELYGTLFGAAGQNDLDRNMQDWARHRIAPWTLAHAGHDVGVGGFRIGFGESGLEILFHFIPDVWGQGLASEFLSAALDHGRLVLQETRFFALVTKDDQTSAKMLGKAGFVARGGMKDGQQMLCLS